MLAAPVLSATLCWLMRSAPSFPPLLLLLLIPFCFLAAGSRRMSDVQASIVLGSCCFLPLLRSLLSDCGPFAPLTHGAFFGLYALPALLLVANRWVPGTSAFANFEGSPSLGPDPRGRNSSGQISVWHVRAASPLQQFHWVAWDSGRAHLSRACRYPYVDDHHTLNSISPFAPIPYICKRSLCPCYYPAQ